MKEVAFILGGLAIGAVIIGLVASGDFGGVVDVVNSLPKHPYKKYGRRNLSEIKYLVIHHTGNFGQTAEQIAKYHVGKNHISDDGIAGIAYHFFINEAGTVYKTNELETVSWHVSNNNTPSVGICLSGNFNERPPTPAQVKSVVGLVGSLKNILGDVSVKPHGYFKQTDCPGRYFDMSIFERFA